MIKMLIMSYGVCAMMLIACGTVRLSREEFVNRALLLPPCERLVLADSLMRTRQDLLLGHDVILLESFRAVTGIAPSFNGSTIGAFYWDGYVGARKDLERWAAALGCELPKP